MMSMLLVDLTGTGVSDICGGHFCLETQKDFTVGSSIVLMADTTD